MSRHCTCIRCKAEELVRNFYPKIQVADERVKEANMLRAEIVAFRQHQKSSNR